MLVDEQWTTAELVEDGVVAAGTITGFAPAYGPDGTLFTAWHISSFTVGSGDQVLSGPGVNGYELIAVDRADRLHVVWWDPDGEGGLVHRWSPIGTERWSPSTLIDDQFATPRLVADDRGLVHVVQGEGDRVLHYWWSEDEGWSDPEDVNGDVPNSVTTVGLASLGDGRIAVLWGQTDGPMQVSVRDADGGWGPPTPVESSTGDAVVRAEVAAGAARLQLVWLTDRNELIHTEVDK